MKKLLWGTIILLFTAVLPWQATAGVDVNIGISLPPIVFPAPPEVVVIPDTNDVYFVPGLEIDIFFWSGWWWRPWEGRWYRSRYYDRGWVYYNRVPSFYFDVDPGWRGYFREHNWHGHRWNYERIPYGQLRQNWKSWHNNRHWERQRTWGVEGYRPRPQQERQQLRRERQIQYRTRPEVQRHEQSPGPQRRPEVRSPQIPKQPEVERRPGFNEPQRPRQTEQRQIQSRDRQPREKSRHEESPGRMERGAEDHRR